MKEKNHLLNHPLIFLDRLVSVDSIWSILTVEYHQLRPKHSIPEENMEKYLSLELVVI